MQAATAIYMSIPNRLPSVPFPTNILTTDVHGIYISNPAVTRTFLWAKGCMCEPEFMLEKKCFQMAEAEPLTNSPRSIACWPRSLWQRPLPAVRVAYMTGCQLLRMHTRIQLIHPGHAFLAAGLVSNIAPHGKLL